MSLLPPESPTLAKRDYEDASEQSRDDLIKFLKTTSGQQAFVGRMRDQLLLQNTTNWGQMLGAAPRALCSIGQCFLTSGLNEDVAIVKLPENSGLTNLSLRSNLFECSNFGRLAFQEADKQMNKIRVISTRITGRNGIVERILTDLGNEEMAKLDLENQMKALEDASQECVKAAISVNERFVAWKDFAGRLQQACSIARDEGDQKSRTLRNQLDSAQFRKQLTHEQIQREDIQAETLRNDRKFHEDMMRKQYEALPAGWAAWFQETVTGLVISVSTVVDKFSIAPASLGLAKTLHKMASRAPPDQYDDDDGAPDRGLELAQKMKRPIEELRDCLTTGDHKFFGVDWNKLYGRSTGAVIVKLHDSLASIKASSFTNINAPDASSSELEASRILDLVLEVATELRDRYEDQESLDSVANEAERREVEAWQDAINKAFCDNGKILAKAQKIEKRSKEEESETPRADMKKSSKWSERNQAMRVYQRTIESLNRSEEYISQQAERQRESQSKFDAIQEQLLELNAENQSMPVVIEILNACLANLVDFQDHLYHLIQFFTGLDHLVGESRHIAEQFLQGTANTFAATLPETRRMLNERLYFDAAGISGSYAVTQEIASVYADVSRQHILPGVAIVERLGLPSGHLSGVSLRQKAIELADHANETMVTINKHAEERRALLREKLIEQNREIEQVRES